MQMKSVWRDVSHLMKGRHKDEFKWNGLSFLEYQNLNIVISRQYVYNQQLNKTRKLQCNAQQSHGILASLKTHWRKPLLSGKRDTRNIAHAYKNTTITYHYKLSFLNVKGAPS